MTTVMPPIPNAPQEPARVLLIEDDKAFAALVCEGFGRVAGAAVSVECIGSVTQALSRLAQGRFDLVVTDLSLPDARDLDAVRALGEGAKGLVVVLTGERREGLREAALALGVVDLIEKDRLDDAALSRLAHIASVQASALRSLRASEAHLKAIVNAEPECVKLIDAGGRLLEMNAAGLRMIETDSLESVRGQCVFGLVAAEHREAFRELTARVAAGGEGTLEFEIIGLKGGRRWLETRAVPLESQGGPPLVLGITRDISARKQAEAELLASKETQRLAELEYRSIFENTVEGVYRVDAKGRVVNANPALAGMLGYDDPCELMTGIGDVAREVYVHAADRRRFRELLQGQGVVTGFETEWRRRDGSLIWVSLSARRLRDPRTGETFHLGTAVDITARMRAEQDLQRFRLAMDNSADIIVLIDREAMRFVDVNSTACRLLGYSRRELLALGPQDVLPVSREALERSYDELIARPSVVGRMNSRYRCKDGSELPFESTRHVLRSGDKWFIAAISRDIRERLAAERALREGEERFRALTELSSDMFWEQDAEYRFVSLSGNVPEHLRPGRMQQIGKRRWDTGYFNMDAAAWAAHRADLDARRAFRDLELGRFDETGDRVWESVSGAPVFDASGAFRGYRGVGKDITARKREERLLGLEHAVARLLAEARAVPESLRAVIRAICDSENWECGRLFQLDAGGEVMRASEVWAAAGSGLEEFVDASHGLAYRRGEGLIGAVWRSGELLWVSDAASDPRVAQKTLARRLGAHSALVAPIAFEGSVIGVLSISSTRVREPDARLLGTLGQIGAQLGQYLMRKRAELALGESEARFRQTFELAASGIAHVGMDGRFLRVNRRLCDLLGYTEEELLGLTVRDVSHVADRSVSREHIDALRRGERESVRFEKRYVRKDGGLLWANINVALVPAAGDAPGYEISVFEDITERKESEASLLRRDEQLSRFRAALDASADMVFLVDMRDMRLVDFNETACDYLGYRREELLGLPAYEVLAGVTGEELRASQARLLDREDRADMLVRTYRRKDGSVFESEVLRRIVDSRDGPILVVNVRDLTERRRSEARQAAHLRYQEATARFGQSALGKRDAGGLIEDAVETLKTALQEGAAVYLDLAQHPGQAVVHGAAGLGQLEAGSQTDARALVEAGEMRIADGAAAIAELLPFPWAARFQSLAFARVQGDEALRGVLCMLAPQPDAFGPEESKFLLAAASVLSAGIGRIESEGRLAFLAQFDVLTGLPNRALLRDRFSQLIVQARRHSVSLGVLFIDLDDFKSVNDSLGHAGGDELLKETARRLEGAVRPGDTVARISGDEFAVILNDLARPEDAAIVAQKIINALGRPIALGGQEVFASASIGISVFPADGDDAEALLGAADAAMYRAKQSGRNGYQFFTAEINQRTRARAQLGTELRRALEREEFRLFYQPKYDLRSRSVSGCEALLRWQHPERGMVSPAEFIPVLEETGLIVAVGEWVLRRACEDLRSWSEQGLQEIPVAVNLSARQFRQSDLHERILGIAHAAGVAPERLEIEITESQLMHDPDQAIRTLHALSEAGIRVAIDDFGTGYSSLAYLNRFPVSTLKIDRSFVADVLVDEPDAAIVRTIVDMAKTLGFTVIAEGVEQEAQASFLLALGCDEAQGFLFARPMPAGELAARLRAERASERRRAMKLA